MGTNHAALDRPPIPFHVLATTSGPMQVVALALIVASLAVHVYFLVWCFLFLRRWGREIDERRRRREEQERKLEASSQGLSPELL